MKHYRKSLFVFRRDLRLDDNIALLEACRRSDVVIPIFILDPRQASSENSFVSNNSLQFMTESLNDLYLHLQKKGSQLFIFHGIAEKVISELAARENIEAVFFNKDYTPFSRMRDAAIATALHKKNSTTESFQGLLLTNPETLRNKSDKPYTVFTPFFKQAMTEQKRTPETCHFNNFYTGPLEGQAEETILKSIVPMKNEALAVHGGAKQAHTILKQLCSFKDYKETRDIPALKTTRLSAHLKFGTVSPHQVIAAIKKEHSSPDLLRQLYWRDFYTHIGYHFPYIFEGKAFNKKYDGIKWKNNTTMFKRWCTGTTGFPIVDAGMRELNTTGYMHNRVRMITCSFLTKNLQTNWTWGEKYFAQKLVDYDPAVNNGSWQWGASTGADAAPYFRVFNPWLQQKKFDPECIYIKQWIPELKSVSTDRIHTAYNAKTPLTQDYPLPIVDHSETARMAKALFT